MKDIGIYVHIPLCKKKCDYCDFISYCNKDKLLEEYIKYLKQEIRRSRTGNKISSRKEI